MRHLKAKKSSQGVSLVELSLVLLGFALITVLIFINQRSRQAHTEAIQASEAIKTIFKDSQNMLINQVNFQGLDMGVVSNAHNLPSAIGQGPNFHMPWGGSLTLASSTSTIATDDLAALTLTAVPQQQCQEIATTVSPFLYDTTINGQVVALTPGPTTQMPGRANVDFDKLKAQCQATNTMVFRQIKELDLSLFVHPDDQNRDVFNPAQNGATATQLQQLKTNRILALQKRETVQAGL